MAFALLTTTATITYGSYKPQVNLAGNLDYLEWTGFALHEKKGLA